MRYFMDSYVIGSPNYYFQSANNVRSANITPNFGVRVTTSSGQILTSPTSNDTGGSNPQNHHLILSDIGMPVSLQQLVTFQFVKTGSSAITPGTYFLNGAGHTLFRTGLTSDASIYSGSTVVPGQSQEFTSIFFGPSFRFVAPSCSISSSTPTGVQLDTVPATQLANVGDTAGEKDFNISLVCQGGMNLRVTYSDNAASTTNNTNVLTNTQTATQAGVGLQIVSGTTPVTFLTEMNVTTVASDNTPVTIPLKARYIRKSGAVTAGAVQGAFTYTLSYH